MRVAAIDLGTNSFLCLIADVENGKIVKVHEDLTHLVRIGEKVHETRKLQAGALARAEKSFTEFKEKISKFNCEKVLAVATSAARDVDNAQDLIALGKKYDIPIQVISGVEEARLTFTGMAFDRPTLSGVVGIDIGGGSTEIIHQDERGKISGRSVDVGCVRLTELFITADPIPAEDLIKLRKYASEKLAVFQRTNPSEAIAVAGTPCALACLEKGVPFNTQDIHGTILKRRSVQGWVEKLSSLSVEERLKLPGLDRGRADVIVAGGILLDIVGEIIGTDSFSVSVYGARYGLAMAMESRGVLKFVTFALSLILGLSSVWAQSPDARPKFKKKTLVLTGTKVTKKITVEVADTDETRSYGLMFVQDLPPNQGMLFIFDRAEVQSFWMKNTLIPLSIAYFDVNKKLLKILEMVPESLVAKDFKTYSSSPFEAKYALEMNHGWFNAHKVSTGFTLSIK